ncbi:MAG: DUF167 domain-containing protein [Candidatus Pacebacteria bacterium]|nr:DUF167 domain-containing protein [Candidatus Paceibacterota bacterium]
MLIRVKAFPGSKNNEVLELKGGFEIHVREKPISGTANKAIAKALSEKLGIPESQLKIVKGFRERNKVFYLPDTVKINKEK